MDIKGAYLNGVLQEEIYMKQPEGCGDGTDRVCRLVKTLYGLKQAGHEWNKQLDAKLRKRGYKRLLSDPCAYIRWDRNDFAIITIWVNDLLLFALSDNMMDHIKDVLHLEWEVTDLGEPSKIIGIEITHTANAISISQQKYIESILRKEGMEDANPVGMPMDPNVKISPNPKLNEPNRSNAYVKLLGELQFIANST
jgi:uncharacterized protein YuzE